MIEHIQVKSSNLKSVGYDETAKMLEIEFHEGRVYQYFDVPKNIYEELMKASSLGKYHDRIIKNRFRYKRVK